jgi:hypothetical protein
MFHLLGTGTPAATDTCGSASRVAPPETSTHLIEAAAKMSPFL